MHRQLFNQANGFQSSLSEFEFDMNPVDPKSGEHLNKMRDTKLTENYRISIADKFVSPFYPDNEFVPNKEQSWFTRKRHRNQSSQQQERRCCIKESY